MSHSHLLFISMPRVSISNLLNVYSLNSKPTNPPSFFKYCHNMSNAIYEVCVCTYCAAAYITDAIFPLFSFGCQFSHFWHWAKWCFVTLKRLFFSMVGPFLCYDWISDKDYRVVPFLNVFFVSFWNVVLFPWKQKKNKWDRFWWMTWFINETINIYIWTWRFLQP